MRMICCSIVLLLFISLLSGCGFHLRGSQTITDSNIKQLYLETQSPYSVFSKALKQQFNNANITLVMDKSLSPLTLVILTDHQSEREISVSGNGQIRRLTLIQTVQYQLRDQKGHVLQAPRMVSSQRFLTTSQDQMLASDNNKAELQHAMAQDCANQVLIQLHSPETQAIIDKSIGTDQKKSAPKGSTKPVL